MRQQPGLNLSKGGMAELKRRLFFLLVGLMVYRFGVHIPVPGLDPLRVADLFKQNQDNIIGLFNMFTGGALQTMAIFALGIMPYISASIIVQLFSAVSPHLEQLRKEGESGRRKINQYTRYGTLFLALFQAIGMCKFLVSSGVTLHSGLAFYFIGTVTLVTGTMFLMWLGEQISERGIGNGISMIIFAGIVSGLPSALARTFEQAKEGQLQGFTVILIAVIVAAVTAFVVFVEQGQRRITINYAKRQQGRNMMAAQSTHLPLKINISGVIPPIFASSIILFPATIAQLFSGSERMAWLQDIAMLLAPGQGQPLYMLLLSFAIVFFAFFYTAIVFNPRDTAENLKKSGAFIPGIRPGVQTANYIDNVMTRLTLFGALYLVAVVLMPEFMHIAWNVPFYFGGTSLLIIVVVILDFITQVQALMMSHQYESLLKKANLRRGGRGPSELQQSIKPGVF